MSEFIPGHAQMPPQYNQFYQNFDQIHQIP